MEYRILGRTGIKVSAIGVCMKNCPFGVDIINKMKQAAELFGK